MRLSFIDLAQVLLAHWQLLLALPLGAAVIAAAISFLLPKTYTATAIFVVEGNSPTQTLPSGLASIAARFGVDALRGGATTSPRFYADLLRSRTLLDQALESRVADPRTQDSTDSSTVFEILDVDGPTPERRQELARIDLAEGLAVRFDRETAVVSLSVETLYQEFSADVANLLVALVNRFNLETRQTNAHQRRVFAKARLDETERELDEAESELQRFLERNRGWEASSELRFQSERLQRRVVLLQEVVTGLRMQYEQARIDEVNDTPLITPVDRAVPPARKSKPKRTVITLTAGVIGGLGAVLLVLWREYLTRPRGRPSGAGFAQA